MFAHCLNRFNRWFSAEDLGKLCVRLLVGGLMLFHGIHKLLYGVGGIEKMLAAHDLPQFIAYGTLIGEIVAPILLILGILTRFSAVVVAFTMVVAWLLAGINKTFMLDATGAWAIENMVYYFIASLAILFLGCGKYSVLRSETWR